VQPFASLIDMVSSKTPRLLINMTKAGQSSTYARLLGMGGGGLDFDSKDNVRDVLCLGSSDEMCSKLAERLDWKADFDYLIESFKEV
jgi:hypothetical protein